MLWLHTIVATGPNPLGHQPRTRFSALDARVDHLSPGSRFASHYDKLFRLLISHAPASRRDDVIRSWWQQWRLIGRAWSEESGGAGSQLVRGVITGRGSGQQGCARLLSRESKLTRPNSTRLDSNSNESMWI